MSVSAIFGTRIAPTPFTIVSNNFTVRNEVKFRASTSGVALIECSSRPQKKATAHHKKTRPKKTQPWDIRRGPTVYAPLPPLPPEWSLVSSASEVDDSSSDVAAADVGVGSTLTAE